MTFCRIAAVLVLVAASLFAQSNPVPFINNPLVPDAVAPGGPDFTLTVNGTGFVPGSVVQWNGTSLATTYVSGSQVTATVPASDVAIASTASVTVRNPPPGGGPSNKQSVQVRSATPGISFGETNPFSVSGYAADVPPIVGDLNGDGKPDLVFVSNGKPFATVLVSLGNGDGTFQPLIHFHTRLFSAVPTVVGDFNGDGLPDLVLSGYTTTSSFVTLLTGNGDGTFQGERDIYVTNTGATTFAAAGDFNSDGFLDLAVGVYSYQADAQVAILIGNGRGNFQSPVFYTVGQDAADQVIAGDFNRDGKLDLVIAINYQTLNAPEIAVILGNGDGTFGPIMSYPVPRFILSLVSADLDGNGTLDLAAELDGLGTSTTTDILYFSGNGDGTFAPYSTITKFGTTFASLLNVADLNGDGVLDLVTFGDYTVSNGGTRAVNQLAALYGRGDGSFDIKYFPSPYLFTLSAADFNGDGKTDLAGVGERTSFGTIYLYVFTQSNLLTSASFLSYGEVEDGTSVTAPVILTNKGGKAIRIKDIYISRADAYSQTNDCDTMLDPGASCTIQVTFTPPGNGFYDYSILNISNSDVTGPVQVGLKGAGVDKGAAAKR